jgi:hypothetical protein
MLATSSGKRRVLTMGALAAVLPLAMAGLLAVRNQERRASPVTEWGGLDEARPPRASAQANEARAPRRAAALGRNSQRPAFGWLDDDGPDASTASRVMPAWLDAGRLGFDDLAGHWEKERKDPEWSSNVRSYLSAMLEPEELDLDLLRDIDCRETLCRVEMNAAHMPVIARLRGGSGPDRARFAHKWTKEVDGASVVVVYTARDDLSERVFPNRAAAADAADSVAAEH